ncbi:hypothetical protein JCM8097_003221 [Rhodosporidiobolus ruineniae]
MATQTTLKATPAIQHPLSLPMSIQPVPSSSSCTHLTAWLTADSGAALARLKLAARWDTGLTGKGAAKTSPSPPTCSSCSTSPLRPFLCLVCASVTCGGLNTATHAAAHASKEHHPLAWDLRSRAPYCFGCKDYVRHPAVERVAAVEQLAMAEKVLEQGEGRATKRKRTSIQAWELAASESSLAVPARGIRNLGQSCYMSVILQTFFFNPYLRAHYLSDRHNRLACDKTRAGEACLSCEVDRLFSEQYAPETTPHAPTRFLHSFWQCSIEAAGYAQQDAHEFLISTLNLLHSSSPSHTDNPALVCPCIVHQTFSGQLRSAIACGRCGHQSETFEPFLDLSLDIRDREKGGVKETLRGCLESFTSPEKLPSKYDCAACGPGVPAASKRLSLKSLPNVVCIQLKRFEHTSTAAKIDAPIRYPLKLDMSPFLSTNIDYPAAAKTNPLNATSLYNLTAVVAHEGTLSQGHYTSYVRGTDDFFALDDDKVRRARISEVLAAKAYLLVYSRI